MVHKRRKPNYKNLKILPWPLGSATPEEIAREVRYEGSAHHKDYHTALTGAPALRSDATKCPRLSAAEIEALTEVLRVAIRKECVGYFRGRYPQTIWGWYQGELCEAQLTNPEQGTYHGYPVVEKGLRPIDREGRLNWE